MFVGDPLPPEFANRLAGFRASAAEAGLNVEVLATGMSADAVHATLAGRTARGDVPDGVLAASDIAAMATLRALVEASLDVPGDTSVIGYDNVTLAAHTSPPLTTIKQDLAKGAALMADRLLRRIAGEEAGSAIVPPELTIRDFDAMALCDVLSAPERVCEAEDCMRMPPNAPRRSIRDLQIIYRTLSTHVWTS